MTLATDDLNDAQLFAQGPPHDLFAQLREAGPLHWSDPSGDLPGYHSVLRFDDVVAANKDWRTFSSAQDGITIREGAVLPKEFSEFAFVFMDPPQHTPHRAVLQKVFTAGAVAARAHDIRGIANRVIDDVIERGECDLVTDIAARFPLVVTSNMLGVPEPDHGKLFAWTNAMADTELAKEPQMQAMGEMFAYITDLIGKRRDDPQDDLLTRIIQAENLSDMDVALHFIQLTAGGNETTRDAFAGGMEALMAHPDQRRALLDDPALIPNAVEEILRWHTPIHCMARTATTDTEIGGASVAQGERVLLWYCSANRDPRANDDPDRFDVTRPRANHVSFGGGGIHYCIGNQLSRLELNIVLEEVLRRMPDAEPAGPAVRHPSTVFHSMASLPVTFTCAA